MAHPYSDLPQEAFWKTGVADRTPSQVNGLWQPRHAILKSHKIVTFGSCFAQHISRELLRLGYGWHNAEAAPVIRRNADYALKFGYGVFSARTGNIYTAALLRQWAEWATGAATPPDEIWQAGDRVQDPFRPNIEPDGFASVDEVLTTRAVTIERFRRAIEAADWLVFTMGQTESWGHVDGHFYPMCPGTIAGDFDAEKHRFSNPDADEIEAHMRAAIAIFRGLKPDLKILLTVSPVPMIATASGQHVLVANAYTKTTLRQVAQRLLQDENIDYFPSYELVTSPVYGGQFFEPNMRSVSPEGVRMVMKHFRKGLESFGELEPGQKPTPVEPSEYEFEETENEIVCEEQMLEAFSRR